MAHYKQLSRYYGILYNHSKRLSSTKILSTNNAKIVSTSSSSCINQQQHRRISDSVNDGTKSEFPGGRFSVPPSSEQNKRPSIRVGGGGVSLGPEFEPELKDLPWEPADIHPEKPPPGYMNIDGFFDGEIQVDSKKYTHSLFIMPQFLVKWHVNKLEDITPEHFALATIHYPAISYV